MTAIDGLKSVTRPSLVLKNPIWRPLQAFSSHTHTANTFSVLFLKFKYNPYLFDKQIHT